MHGMDEMWGGGMFRRDPMMALMDGRADDHRHRHRDGRHGHDVQPGRPHSSDVAPHGGRHDPFSFMSSMMSNMHGMMGNAFRQMVSSAGPLFVSLPNSLIHHHT